MISHPVGKYTAITILFLGLFLVVYMGASTFFKGDFVTTYEASAVKSHIVAASEPEKVLHLQTPSQVKAIYMSQCVVGTRDFRDRLVALTDETEINSIMIDIKDYTGRISFSTDNPKLNAAVSDECGTNDMKEFIELLHSKNIYVIGRITVFQDPYMVKIHPDRAVQSKAGGVWRDYKGLGFIDVGAQEHWDYIIELAKESYAIGFDEINFDYVRFPSDGKMIDALYTRSFGKSKPEALREFFEYLHNALKDTGMKTSADLFGMVTTNTDDLNIGQVLENALPYFDYIAPMVYPSHYPKNFNGWSNPNEHAAEVVHFTMKSAVDRARDFDRVATGLATSSAVTITYTIPEWYKGDSTKKFRTWIQDFKYGGTYDAATVKAEIQASYAAGVDSWMVWNAANSYTRAALEKQ